MLYQTIQLNFKTHILDIVNFDRIINNDIIGFTESQSATFYLQNNRNIEFV